jgi:hypothetical protein
LLRQASAEARGFGDDVKLPALAKLMLAERFLTRVFDQIATAAASDPDGKCGDLAVLEESVAEPKVKAVGSAEPAEPSRSKGSAKTQMVKPATESAQVTEWLSSQAVKSWARIAPPIGTLDLRPYLFVAKDRKDYFGATSVLGHLAAVAESGGLEQKLFPWGDKLMPGGIYQCNIWQEFSQRIPAEWMEVSGAAWISIPGGSRCSKRACCLAWKSRAHSSSSSLGRTERW